MQREIKYIKTVECIRIKHKDKYDSVFNKEFVFNLSVSLYKTNVYLT